MNPRIFDDSFLDLRQLLPHLVLGLTKIMRNVDPRFRVFVILQKAHNLQIFRNLDVVEEEDFFLGFRSKVDDSRHVDILSCKHNPNFCLHDNLNHSSIIFSPFNFLIFISPTRSSFEQM